MSGIHSSIACECPRRRRDSLTVVATELGEVGHVALGHRPDIRLPVDRWGDFIVVVQTEDDQNFVVLAMVDGGVRTSAKALPHPSPCSTPTQIIREQAGCKEENDRQAGSNTFQFQLLCYPTLTMEHILGQL